MLKDLLTGKRGGVCTFGSGRLELYLHLRVCIPYHCSTDWGYTYVFFAINFRELEREKVWSRVYLLPALMAEGDRDMYRRQQAMIEREREIMKDVPGWEVSNNGCCGDVLNG